MERPVAKRELVVPGDPLESRGLKPGSGTYSENGRIYAAQLGIRDDRDGFVQVIPLGGKYIPREGDAVVGKIIDVGPSFWLVDINSPYPGPLHVTEVPWKVEFGDTQKFLNVEDVILAMVGSVDETKRVSVTMRDRSSRKLTGGQIVEISHAKVPRVIGKKGSMINLIKDHTGCRIFVGQNGRIWVDGSPEGMALCIKVIHLIEDHAQVAGLTELVKETLERARVKGLPRGVGRDGQDGET